MVAARIALRYLFSKKTHNAVNVISVISVAGIAVATVAIVVVLSVFNGFSWLAGSRLSLLDPEIKVEPAQGKVIADGDSLAAVLQRLPAVAAAVPVVEDQALAIARDRQVPVRIKGVPYDRYDSVTCFRNTVIAGEAWNEYWRGAPAASLSVGVANSLHAIVGVEQWVGLYTPRRRGRINPANPAAAFRSDSVAVGSVFRIDQAEYDNDYVVVDISVARRLLDYTAQASAVEVALVAGADPGTSVTAIKEVLGSGYRVKTRIEQQASSFRMIQVEKWITFMLLGFILVIASFNIISTLSMLIIEKEGSILTLRSMGASTGMIRRVFAIQGWLITVAGGMAGAVVGVVLCLLQQWFGLIKLAGDPSAMSITVYPVKVEPADLLTVIGLILVIGILTSMVAVRIPSGRRDQ